MMGITRAFFCTKQTLALGCGQLFRVLFRCKYEVPQNFLALLLTKAIMAALELSEHGELSNASYVCEGRWEEQVESKAPKPRIHHTLGFSFGNLGFLTFRTRYAISWLRRQQSRHHPVESSCQSAS